jgi:hypothetical protein
MFSKEELVKMRDEYLQAEAMFAQQADQNMQLSILNKGAASAIEDLLKKMESEDEGS